MSPEEMLINEITKDLPEWANKEVREKYTNYLIQQYRRNDYRNLGELITRVKRDLKLNTYLDKGTTVKEYANGAGVSLSAARNRLIEGAATRTEKRPYIYQGWGRK